MAVEYDAMAESHPVVIWERTRIRELVEQQLTPGASILEINCGSGLDAAYFARRGFRVHATDVAPEMLQALAVKASAPEIEGRLTFENLSNTDLDKVEGAPFDLVFSNLGGLNCIADLSAVTEHLPSILAPGGKTVLVVMPPVCPWEALQVFRGHIGTALRRFRPGVVEANVGGHRVHTWYHTPSKLERALGDGFETLALRSFCTFAPPPYFEGFVKRHEGFTRRLMAMDDRLGATWPLNRMGDFYALVSRRRT
jgi:SAM-dependent methyltransferase